MHVFFDDNRMNHAIAKRNVLPEETIAYLDDFSLGGLSLVDSEERNRFLIKLGCPAVNKERNQQSLNSVLKSPDDTLFWISNNPHELSAFCMFCHKLEEQGTKQIRIIFGNAVVEPSVSADYFSVSASSYARMWENALKENGILRTVIDEELVTVPESYYDSYLDACDSPSEAVYRILKEKGILVSWFYLNDRFQKLHR